MCIEVCAIRSKTVENIIFEEKIIHMIQRIFSVNIFGIVVDFLKIFRIRLILIFRRRKDASI